MKLVAEGYKYEDKPYIMYDTTTLRSCSFRLIVYFSPLYNLRLFSHDVKQSYLQTKQNLSCKVYIPSKPENISLYWIQSDELMDLNKPLHGIYEACGYWEVTFDEHIMNYTGTTPVAADTAFRVERSETGRWYP